MTVMQRIRGFITGLIMVIFGVIFFVLPDESYPLISAILSLVLLFRGINLLIYYFKMARYMVDGRSMLYQAIILIDLGIFTGSLTQVPLLYVMLYLITIYIFSGVIEILQALESRRYGSSWKVTMLGGAINVLMAVLCLVFIKTTSIAVMIYAAGIVYSGFIRMIQSCRRTAMVYIQ